jgi:hypothetical protein
MRVLALGALMLAVSTGAVADEITVPDATWQELAPGMELGVFPAKVPSHVGDSRITILRMDPERWELVMITAGKGEGSSSLTAKEWSADHGLTAVTNAGMFGEDHRTHVGYMRFRDEVNNGRTNKYQSVAAFDPTREGIPRFRMFDLDAPGVSMEAILDDYASAVQNLRLIKRPGRNRWSQQEKKWSEAALGEDDEGRILFIFCRSPYTMHDLNRELVGLGIGVVCAQHLEGGPEAQLYVKTEERELELCGSFETFFIEHDKNIFPWPVPNVLGVRPRVSGTE